MYVGLHAYQHHVFMDWRFGEDEKWRDIYVALNGAGVESMQAKWDEMFEEKEEEERSKHRRRARARRLQPIKKTETGEEKLNRRYEKPMTAAIAAVS